MSDELVRLLWVPTVSEAEIVVDLLAANGIPAVGPGGESQALEGIAQSPDGGGVEIFVKPEDLEDAKSLLPD
jgi:putative signal transducing protein